MSRWEAKHIHTYDLACVHKLFLKESSKLQVAHLVTSCPQIGFQSQAAGNQGATLATRNGLKAVG